MANFKHETPEEKARLKERAEILKPRNVSNLVATELGWAQSRPNGTLELLVSFRGLDALLGDVEPEVIDETPIEVTVEAHVEAPVEEAPAEEPVVVAPKKAGRPKKAD